MKNVSIPPCEIRERKNKQKMNSYDTQQKRNFDFCRDFFSDETRNLVKIMKLFCFLMCGKLKSTEKYLTASKFKYKNVP